MDYLFLCRLQKEFSVLLAVEIWIILVAAQEEYFTAGTTNKQDASAQLEPSTETVTTHTLTSETVEESNGHVSEPPIIITATIKDTSTKPFNELEFTQQEILTEQNAAKTTTEPVTANSVSETSGGLSVSTEFGNVLEVNTGVPVDAVKVSDSQVATGGPDVTEGVETTESGTSIVVLGAKSISNADSNTLSTEQVPVIESETTVPNSVEISSHGPISNFNDVCSTTECSEFPDSVFSISFDTNNSHYQCTRPGHFPARPSCTDYHVCRLVGFWFVHFKQTCHFGLQFNARIRLCVPGYLSDCRISSH
jgi:Chitin binding Peritrophin-A domain.